MDEQEMAEHNAVAWLLLTDEELIERSASLDLPVDLHVAPTETNGGVKATRNQVLYARQVADANAREHAGDEFVDTWIKENREAYE